MITQECLPGLFYNSVGILLYDILLLYCTAYRYILLRTGDESRERENTEDKQEHKPATKTSGTGKRARGSQKPIGPTPGKAGVGETSNQGVLNHRRDQSTTPCRTVGNLDIELIWLRASVLVAGCWLVFLVLGIFTDLSLGRFDCVDFIHTHHSSLVICRAS